MADERQEARICPVYERPERGFARGCAACVTPKNMNTSHIAFTSARLQASGAKLVTVSRVSVCVWAIIMGCAMSIAQAATINVNWLITIVGSPSLPPAGAMTCGVAVHPAACAWRSDTKLPWRP